MAVTHEEALRIANESLRGQFGLGNAIKKTLDALRDISAVSAYATPTLFTNSTPGYAGKMELGLSLYGKDALMTLVLFAPGDGTGGGETSVERSKVIIPPELKSIDDRILPRKKDCALEVMFPIHSFKQPSMGAGSFSLKEYGLLGQHVQYIGEHTTLDMNAHSPVLCTITTGYLHSGERIGDPHSIYYDPTSKNAKQDILQVAGFLSIDRNHQLCRKLDRISIIPYS
jgi:hypothetical protein